MRYNALLCVTICHPRNYSDRFTVDLELIGRPLMDCLAAVLFLALQILGALIVQVCVCIVTC